MKNYKTIIILLGICLVTACDDFLPESKLDNDLREDQASVSYGRLKDQGMSAYEQIPLGYDRVSGAMLASATDEADYAIPGSDIEKFNNGSWSAISNPDDVWEANYRGIRLANLFLENSEDYRHIIVRDTTKQTGKNTYKEQCDDLEWLRNESYILRAYFYFELIKRYGGVPLIKEAYKREDQINVPRSSYDAVVTYILEQIELAMPNLQEDWRTYKATFFGRIDKGMAMALKSRVLLYWASPLNNPENDKHRWEMAAKAAHDLIVYGKYSLETSGYGNLFIGARAHQSSETIFARMTGSNNAPETKNYPIGTDGGATGNCPSGNLVDAYEYINGTPFDWATLTPGVSPYDNRDPRLAASIVVNNSSWNDRTIECWQGGKDGRGSMQSTTTGYYLKKFLTDKLDLSLGQKAIHSWILFRYGEILLNYAEAMNEAYGPDVDFFGDGRTARWAINQIRDRTGVKMPPVAATDYEQMKVKIKHERRIELAFEEHRQWDVRRWGSVDAQAVLGTPLLGIEILKENNTFIYTPVEVDKRVFSNKMLLYPLPHSEVLLSGRILTQNPEW